MNLLYVCNQIEIRGSGGNSINARNMKYLERYCNGKMKVCEIKSRENIVAKIFDYLIGYSLGMSISQEKKVLRMIDECDIDIVFIGHALFGKIVKKIKKQSGATCITFFHNVEKKYARDMLKYSGIKNLLFYRSAVVNEQLALKFSDHLICMNDRDSEMIASIYNRKPDLALPTTMRDAFNGGEKDNRYGEYVLFVGTYFFANIEAAEWLVRELSGRISCNIIIAGGGMANLKKDFHSVPANVIIIDYIEDLCGLYANAYAVVIPIFSGSGMKTKTAEALMHGKRVFGTAEALEGYPLIDGVIEKIDSVGELAAKITALVKSGVKYNADSRRTFLKSYDYYSHYEQFHDFMNSVNRM
jgi:polysaccharide biosynthesis protein PslH